MRLIFPVLFACLAAGPVHADVKKAVTTFTVIADMARNVGGDHWEVVSITRPGAEIHTYSPTPRDLVAAQDADLILWNGLNLELWFEKFFARLRGVPEIVVSEGVAPISIASGPYGGKPNPHAWMSPVSAGVYVDNIRDAFSELDPENATVFAANAEAYKTRIRDALGPARARLANVPEDRRWLVTSEGAFSYLARDLELKELYLWPINADARGTPKRVRDVIDTMRTENIGVIFSESTVSPDPARRVARETGAAYGGVLYVDSLSAADGPVPSYLDLLRATTETIASGLAE